jgi:hypothetical protein
MVWLAPPVSVSWLFRLDASVEDGGSVGTSSGGGLAHLRPSRLAGHLGCTGVLVERDQQRRARLVGQANRRHRHTGPLRPINEGTIEVARLDGRA